MTLTGITISDFNSENLNALLCNSPVYPDIGMISLPFGQVHQILIDREAQCWKQNVDFAVVWTQPQTIIAGFKRALDFEPVTIPELLEEVKQFCSHIIALQERVKTIFVPAWVQPVTERGLGIADLGDPRGGANLLMRMNLQLTESMREYPGIHVLNTARWVQAAGPQAFSPKLWYMAKMAFSNRVFKQAAAEIREAIGLAGKGARKLVVVDLDNTIWGGIVGDCGWEGLTLGGHDAVGEAFADFQMALKRLRSRGVLLAIVSKNDESVAMGAIEKHPEMLLRKDDFSAWRINWNDKAQNLVEIVAELNLGIGSVVFIDDNLAERARVAESLPEVYVPDWPSDPLEYPMTLAALGCFDSLALSEEDLQRANMYQEEQKRDTARLSFDSMDDWLKTLDMRVAVEQLSTVNLPRATQLLNKTNQMNLKTRRMAESEFLAWAKNPDTWVWTFSVNDRFGVQGLTGLLSAQRDGERFQIVDLVLSCRVMGRKIEEAMLAFACRQAIEQGCIGIDVQYEKTAANRPILDSLKKSVLQGEPESLLFQFETENPFPVPEHIRLEQTDEGRS